MIKEQRANFDAMAQEKQRRKAKRGFKYAYNVWLE